MVETCLVCSSVYKIDLETRGDSSQMKIFDGIEIAIPDVDRRQFLKGVGVAGVTMVAGGLLAGCGGNGTSAGSVTTGYTDTDILNFALNLEYLEAEFYAYATTGAGLSSSLFTGTGTQGATTGGVQISMDSATRAIALEIAQDELHHVEFLRAALGASAVAKPAINLAALGSVTTQAGFLALARAFEDVGVSAYGGAAPLIASKAYLQAAAQILATEAYHAGNIRLQVAQQSVATTAVDGSDILPPPSGSSYFAVDSTNSLSVIRTPRQVLNIVYGAVNATSGGFFPNGMNGAITS
jgi:hypothetical protein